MTMHKPEPKKTNTGGRTKTGVTNNERDTLTFVSIKIVSEIICLEGLSIYTSNTTPIVLPCNLLHIELVVMALFGKYETIYMPFYEYFNNTRRYLDKSYLTKYFNT